MWMRDTEVTKMAYKILDGMIGWAVATQEGRRHQVRAKGRNSILHVR